MKQIHASRSLGAWLLLGSLLLLRPLAGTAADYKPESYRYELASGGVGANESTLYRVVCYVKTPPEAEAVAAECAVHGIIFSGSSAANGNAAQTPLCKAASLSNEQLAFFDRFFGKKEYKSYVVAVAKNSMRVTKLKKEYKVEIIVSVNKRKLRRDLEQAGMVEKLGSALDSQS